MALVKQQADELDALKRIGLNLTSSLDLQVVLETVVTEAMKLMKNSRAAHIFLYSHGKLEFGASLSSDGVANKPVSMPRSNGLTYLVANNGLPIIIENIQTHPLYKDTPQEWHGSIIGIPLKFSNSIVGVMNISRSTTGGFSRSELRLMGLLADQAAVAISNASLHKDVSDLANTDSVTGLPNRRALDERLQDEMRYAKSANSKFSVVMMDLDGFKNVNDTLGHSIGDDVLRHAFNYLAEKMRATDFLARYGGDELTLIMRDSDIEVAEIVTNKIIELMKAYSYPIPGSKPIQLGITAGIAVYPLHSHNASDLLRAADAALYQAKKYNRGKFIVAKPGTGPLDPLNVRSTKKE
jgi:diguanylate cyclase (GGDEF)-like protein